MASAEPVRLPGAAEIRGLAAELGLRPSKQRGQHFVIDPNTVRRIVATAELDPGGEHVLEVGPGLGSLTLGLLGSGHRVTAVEIDHRLAARLPDMVAGYAPDRAKRLTVVGLDALALTGAQAGEPTALVANLPYNVAVPVLLHLLADLASLRHGLVMVQAEVAERLAASPGSRAYGVPSAKAAWYAEMRRAGTVARTVFWPAPNVDSGLVRFTRRDPPAGDRQRVFAVIDAAFSQRRKTLRSALARWAGDRARLTAILADAGVDSGLRGEALGVVEFAAIANAATLHPRHPRQPLQPPARPVS